MSMNFVSTETLVLQAGYVIEPHCDVVSTLETCPFIDFLYEKCDHYEKEMYNCPCQIHQTHICHIVEAPPLKDGTGKGSTRYDEIASIRESLSQLPTSRELDEEVQIVQPLQTLSKATSHLDNKHGLVSKSSAPLV